MKPNKIISIVLFLVILYLMVLINGLSNAMIFICALFIHEGFHLISAGFLQIKLDMPLISPLGLRFETDFDSLYGLKGALVILSGAFGNLIFALFVILLRKYIHIYNSDMFIFYNLIFALINLIPAFPMDASRAICALLSVRLGRLKAVKITAFISELIAYTMFLTGAYVFILKTDNMLLMILSVMIFYYSGKEKREAENDFVKGKLNKLYKVEYIKK